MDFPEIGYYNFSEIFSVGTQLINLHFCWRMLHLGKTPSVTLMALHLLQFSGQILFQVHVGFYLLLNGLGASGSPFPGLCWPVLSWPLGPRDGSRDQEIGFSSVEVLHIFGCVFILLLVMYVWNVITCEKIFSHEKLKHKPLLIRSYDLVKISLNWISNLNGI